MKKWFVVMGAGAIALSAGAAFAGFGYGVGNDGGLFRFDLDNPATSVVDIGNIGFVPEGIDFRPGTPDLYAIDVGPNVTQLYRINIETAQVVTVGASFTSTGGGGASPAYDLTGNQTFGFDFNPTTLQPDDSMRIRLVGSSGVNMRLNSSTGGIAGVDVALAYAGGTPTPAVDAAAYINSASATAGGATQLFVLDYANNQLSLQNPPNAGTLTEVGPFGVTINNTLANTGFDILTDPDSVDSGIGGDTGYAVLRRPDSPIGDPGIYLIYNVNLATGQLTNGSRVGLQGFDRNFNGGFAVSTFIPSTSTCAALVLPAASLLRRRRN